MELRAQPICRGQRWKAGFSR